MPPTPPPRPAPKRFPTARLPRRVSCPPLPPRATLLLASDPHSIRARARGPQADVQWGDARAFRLFELIPRRGGDGGGGCEEGRATGDGGATAVRDWAIGEEAWEGREWYSAKELEPAGGLSWEPPVEREHAPPPPPRTPSFP